MGVGVGTTASALGVFGLHFAESPESTIGPSIFPKAMSAAERIGVTASSIPAPPLGGIRVSSGYGEASMMSPTAAIVIASGSAGLSSMVWALAIRDDEPDAPQPIDISIEINKTEILSLIRVNRATVVNGVAHASFKMQRKHTIMPAKLASGKFRDALST